MYFDACHKAAKSREHARQPFKAFKPQPVRQAIMQNGMNARVSGKHFKVLRAAGSRSNMQAMSSRSCLKIPKMPPHCFLHGG